MAIAKFATTGNTETFPMIKGIHMLVNCLLTAKLAGAGLAFKLWGMVIQCIHVLIAGPLGAEHAIASVAFNPMMVLIHMLIAIFTILEVIGAGRTFVHFGQT
jgi:hypothetical protein